MANKNFSVNPTELPQAGPVVVVDVDGHSHSIRLRVGNMDVANELARALDQVTEIRLEPASGPAQFGRTYGAS